MPKSSYLCHWQLQTYQNTLRYFIDLSYNGTAYHGWQVQPNAQTVQEALNSALTTLLKVKTSVMGAGRTDTGVHAQQMIAHFDSLVPIDGHDLVHKLNSYLPKDIAIHKIFEVQPNTHARFDALSRTYIYQIALKKEVFNFDQFHRVNYNLDMNMMNQSAAVLFEYSDFKCFSRSNTDVKTYTCKIMEASWTTDNQHLIFKIKADRFLRNMVRAIVGTMLEVGKGKMTLAEFHKIINSRDRSTAGPSAPAKGLFLTAIEYPESILKPFQDSANQN